MKKILWGVLVLCVVGLVTAGWWYLRLRSAAQQWEGPVAEILSEKLEKDTDTMEIEFTSRVDAPVDAVFRAFAEPERSQEFSDSVRYAKLLSSEGNRKTVEFEMVILGQPQRLTLEFTFVPEEHRVAIRTIENQFSDLGGVPQRGLPEGRGRCFRLSGEEQSEDGQRWKREYRGRLLRPRSRHGVIQVHKAVQVQRSS